MADPSNVVSLRERRSDEPREFPRLIRELRSLALQTLQARCEDLFNNLDDALFELADRATSDVDQNLYFDAMRSLRLERQPVCARFVEELDAGFAALHGPSAAADVEASEEIDFDDLGLVDSEDMEIDVAKAGIVSKSSGLYARDIAQLTQRLAVVFPAAGLTARSNPMAPHAVCEGFARASAGLDLNIRIRLILLKLFERFVMEQLASFYHDANKQLADAGVLKDARDFRRAARARQERNSSSRESAPSVTPVPTAAPTPVSDHDSAVGGALTAADEHEYAALTDLLHAALEAGTGGIRSRAAMVPAGGAGPAVPTSSLLNQLDATQQEYASASDLTRVSVTPAPLNVGALLGAAGGQHLQQHDADVVNLVGMLFDYILNDRNLAIPMKALLGRLQIPILKVALQDKAFFTRSRHPARQLLNELSSAGIGWSSAQELKRDALYTKIESVVADILSDFDTDASLFARLLEDLRAFVQTDSKRARAVEQRTRDAEIGRARTRAARTAVNRMLSQKASGLQLDAAVQRFVADQWTRVLTFLHLRDGDESDRWFAAIATLDDLLTAAGACDDNRLARARAARRPALLAAISEGLRLIGIQGSEVDATVSALDRTLQRMQPADGGRQVDHPLWAEHMQAAPSAEIVLACASDENIEEPQVSPASLGQVDALQVGQWIEIREPGKLAVRCRLVTHIADEARFVFANRRGMKVAERTRLDLASGLERGHLALLEDAEVFDRALQSVIGDLRRNNDRTQ